MESKKFVFLALGFIIVAAVGLGIYVAKRQTPAVSQITSKNTQGDTIPTVSVQPTKSDTVPIPTETDIIRTFIALINEHRAADAVAMLAPDQVKDDNNKQAWAVQFNAFSTLTVTSIEPALQEDWSDTRHEYKVVVDATMKPESASAPIPYYGWGNGSNTRWVMIVKSGTVWKISGVGTGP